MKILLQTLKLQPVVLFCGGEEGRVLGFLFLFCFGIFVGFGYFFRNASVGCYHSLQSMLYIKNKGCSKHSTLRQETSNSFRLLLIASHDFSLFPHDSSHFLCLIKSCIKVHFCRTQNIVSNLHPGSFPVCSCDAECRCSEFQTVTEDRIRLSFSITGAE